MAVLSSSLEEFARDYSNRIESDAASIVLSAYMGTDEFEARKKAVMDILRRERMAASVAALPPVPQTKRKKESA